MGRRKENGGAPKIRMETSLTKIILSKQRLSSNQIKFQKVSLWERAGVAESLGRVCYVGRSRKGFEYPWVMGTPPPYQVEDPSEGELGEC